MVTTLRMRGRSSLGIIAIVSIVSMMMGAGCQPSPPPHRSPSAEDDPVRAERATQETDAVEQGIRQAEQENARRQGTAPPMKK
jgi:hypothetical protein